MQEIKSSSCALLTILASAVLFACGGDSEVPHAAAPSNDPPMTQSAPKWERNEFEPASVHANRCTAPRSGDDPLTGEPYVDQAGRALDEKLWIRAWINETYLWYDEVQDSNPSSYDLAEYFHEQLRSDEIMPSGRRRDPHEFRFMMPTDEYRALAESGSSVGLGVRWVFRQSTPPRDIRVAYVEPGSPADKAGLRRGDRLHRVNGAEVVDGDEVETINRAFAPTEQGESFTLRVHHSDDKKARTHTVVAEQVSEAPVPVVKTLETAQGTVGYLLFQDHSAVSEADLQDAMERLETAGVADLVLDLRYNSGGYLAIASHLAYMIAGDGNTAGRVFETVQFNDQHPQTNPVTGEPIQSLPFLGETTGAFVLPAGERLPSLNLSRLFVLTGDNTCSASESIINGLRGAGVEVLQFGVATCGKPYGFYAQDNCGNTFGFSQFLGVNEQGFGDFQNGFQPGGSGPAGLRGCMVVDDLSQPLGHRNEARLAAALAYRQNASCGPESSLLRPMDFVQPAPVSDGYMPKPAAQQNKRL